MAPSWRGIERRRAATSNRVLGRRSAVGRAFWLAVGMARLSREAWEWLSEVERGHGPLEGGNQGVRSSRQRLLAEK